jgi:hypothetical protein
MSLFRGKLRKPVSLTLTPAHHRKVNKSVRLLGITRADLIGLLIEKYADQVTLAAAGGAYWRLREAVEALGGALIHQKLNEPRGGTWVLTLGDKRLEIRSEQSKRYPLLDACYHLKHGVTVSRTWDDHTDLIDPEGLARLFASLSSRGDAVAD